MADLVIPEWNPDIDWVSQYERFMDIYKLWKPEQFAGQLLSGKEFFQRMVTTMGQDGTGEGYPLKQKMFAWNQLRRAIYHKKKVMEMDCTWLSDKGKYPFRTHVVLNLPKEASLMSAVECARDFLTSCKWIKYAEYCIEYHTESGGHPHCDMAIMTDNKRYSSVANVKSALFDAKNEKIKITALKKYLKDWHSISVTKWNENTLAYVDGDKKAGKMEYVELDRIMRASEGIEDKYVYKA